MFSYLYSQLQINGIFEIRQNIDHVRKLVRFFMFYLLVADYRFIFRFHISLGFIGYLLASPLCAYLAQTPQGSTIECCVHSDQKLPRPNWLDIIGHKQRCIVYMNLLQDYTCCVLPNSYVHENSHHGRSHIKPTACNFLLL